MSSNKRFISLLIIIGILVQCFVVAPVLGIDKQMTPGQMKQFIGNEAFEQSASRYIVKYKDSTGDASLRLNAKADQFVSQLDEKKIGKLTQKELKINQKFITKIKKLNKKNTFAVEMSDAALADLKTDKTVESIEPDSIISKTGEIVPWSIHSMGVDQLHSLSANGDGVKVAILDTGIDLSNPDIKVAGGVSFVDGIDSYDDDNGHGTAIAGILASSLDGEGYLGVSPKVSLYSVKVLDYEGNGYYSDVIAGLDWAAANNIKIAVMSLGGTYNSALLKNAVAEANSRGVLLVAPSGNDASENVLYPAAYEPVVCVGASDQTFEKATFSNDGPQVDILAPGVNIETWGRNQTSVIMNGTSASVPNVAGVAADLLSVRPNYSNDQVKGLLYRNCVRLPESKYNGFGIVNAKLAFANIDGDTSIPDTGDITPLPPGGNDEGTVSAQAEWVGTIPTSINPGSSVQVGFKFSGPHNNVLLLTFKGHVDASNINQIDESSAANTIVVSNVQANVAYYRTISCFNEVNTEYTVVLYAPEYGHHNYDIFYHITTTDGSTTPTPPPPGPDPFTSRVSSEFTLYNNQCQLWLKWVETRSLTYKIDIMGRSVTFRDGTEHYGAWIPIETSLDITSNIITNYYINRSYYHDISSSARMQYEIVLYAYSGSDLLGMGSCYAYFENPESSSGQPGNNESGGDPVNVPVGNFHDSVTDISIETLGIPLALERHYNSRELEAGLLGLGWTCAYDSNLQGAGSDFVTVAYPDGKEISFTRNIDGSFSTQTGEFDTLQLLSGSYILTKVDQSKFTFNSNGKLLTIVDKNGNTINLTYLSDGRLQKATSSTGGELTFQVTNGRITQVTDHTGRTVTYTYDANNQLWKVTNLNGGNWEYQYDGKGYLIKTIDPRNNLFIENFYDEFGRVTTQWDCYRNVVTFEYNDDNRTRTCSYLDSNNNVIKQETYTVDLLNRVTEKRYLDGTTETYTYDDYGNQDLVKDRKGNVTDYDYDARGNLLQIKDALNNLTKYEYDEHSNLEKITYPDGGETNITYDANGNMLTKGQKIDLSKTATTVYTYASLGRIGSITDPENNRTGFNYTGNSIKPNMVSDERGINVTSYTYTNLMQVKTESDVLGTTTYEYDGSGKVITKKSRGATTWYGYDNEGNIIKKIDPQEYYLHNTSGAAYTYVWDPQNKQVSETDPEGNIKAVQYDRFGNKTKEYDPRYYDPANPDSPGTSYQYDADGHVIRITDALGNTSRIKYDANGNKTKEIAPSQYDYISDDGPGITYEYDALNRLVTVKDASGNVTKHYIYDSMGRVLKEMDGRGYAYGTTDATRYGTEYNYNLAGWVTDKWVPLKLENGIIYYNHTRYEYNKNGKVTKEIRCKDYQTLGQAINAARTDTIDYSYYPNDLTKSVSDSSGSYMEYDYDAWGRKILEKVKLDNNPELWQETTWRYGYYDIGPFIEEKKDIGGGQYEITGTTIKDWDGNIINEYSPEGYLTQYEYYRNNLLKQKTENVTAGSIAVSGNRLFIESPRTRYYPDNIYSFAVNANFKDGASNITVIINYDPQRFTFYGFFDGPRNITINHESGKITLTIQNPGIGNLFLGNLELALLNKTGSTSLNIDSLSSFTNIHGTKLFDYFDGLTVPVSIPDMTGDSQINVADLNPIAKKISLDPVEDPATMDMDIDGDEYITTNDLNRVSGYIVNPETANNTPLADNTERTHKSDLKATLSQSEYSRATTYTYDKAGNILTQKDAMGRIIENTYDADGRLSTVKGVNGGITTKKYNVDGQLEKEILPENQVSEKGTTNTYDLNGRLWKVFDAEGLLVVKYGYDVDGNQTTATDANNNATTTVYDLGNRVTGVITPETSAVGKSLKATSYDVYGYVNTVTDALNNTTTYLERDMWGRAKAIRYADGGLETFTYNLAGSIKSSTDANTHTTNYTYNTLNIVSSITDASGKTILYTYYKDGRLKTETDRSGQVKTYSYNFDGNITSVTVGGKNDYILNAYNLDGSLNTAVNNQSFVKFEYNTDGTLKTKTVDGNTISYIWDKDGNVKSVTVGSNTPTTYSYDSNNRLETVSQGSLSAEYQYNNQGLVDTLTYSNGLSAKYDYDLDGKAKKVEYKSGSNVISFDEYTYYLNGNVESENKNGDTVNYTYDARNRLKTEGDVTYNYDPAGNRFSKVIGSQVTTYGYNSLNQLTSMVENGDTISYAYDDNGNLISDSDGNSYTYDSFGYNTGVIKADGTSQYNTYNALGERVAVEENGILTKFLVDNGKVISEQREIPSIDTLKEATTETLYIYGLNQLWAAGDALSDPQPTTNMPTIQEFDRIAISNLHGDITELVKLDNSILNQYTYDAFGNLIDGQETIQNRFKYAGEQQDGISGFYYLRSRYYNPELGCFTQEDLYRGDGLNLYSFVSANPLRYIDPSGMEKLDNINEANYDLSSLASSMIRNRVIYGVGNDNSFADYLYLMLPDAMRLKIDEWVSYNQNLSKSDPDLFNTMYADTVLNYYDALMTTDSLADVLDSFDSGSPLVIAAAAFMLSDSTFKFKGDRQISKHEEETLQAKKVRILNQNKINGANAERLVADLLKEKGYNIVGSRVTVRTKQGIRYVDHLVVDKYGTLVAIEVKFGNAVRSKAQLKKDAAMLFEGGLIGNNGGTKTGVFEYIPTEEFRVTLSDFE